MKTSLLAPLIQKLGNLLHSPLWMTMKSIPLLEKIWVVALWCAYGFLHLLDLTAMFMHQLRVNVGRYPSSQ